MLCASEFTLVCLGLSQHDSICSRFVTSRPGRSARYEITLNGCRRSTSCRSPCFRSLPGISSVKVSKRRGAMSVFPAQVFETVPFSESFQQPFTPFPLLRHGGDGMLLRLPDGSFQDPQERAMFRTPASATLASVWLLDPNTVCRRP